MIVQAFVFVLVVSLLYMLAATVLIVAYLATRRGRKPLALSTRILFAAVVAALGAPLVFAWILSALSFAPDGLAARIWTGNPGAAFTLLFALLAAVAFRINSWRARAQD